MKDGCYVEGCEHPADYMDNSSCACHLDLEFFQKELTGEQQREATRVAALENDKFQVDSGGKVRLNEDEKG